ncbi:bacteriocin biosynthesis cyclodehydratase domain-containing protein [Propionicimonas paludicola]|uniref:Bacteriocin biosynthesis cyclodehydratase domain-containing protein n=1 Tax=Propionicimonas paludicola TaxID=185243 RepID=A0A2A9CR21_9ACTN|nr:hypothetical protein [Propionicimonas paludicola]PFG16874.1 bacteriocin biosynthesis cyclodehydratase domain-containing protein [Propionicimonas paludicola]
MSNPTGRLLQAVRPLTGVWRGEQSLQVGVGPTAVILEPVPSDVFGVLGMLSQPHSIDQLAELCPELGRDWLEWVVDRLTESGLVRPWRAESVRPVVVWGSGPLAERVHAALQRAELHPLPLGQRGWTGAGQPLIVLAGRTAEPDRWLTDRLLEAGRAALVVRAAPDHGTIGPFIEPPHTPCLRCLDLRRSDLDPQWPRLLAQLCRTPVSPDPRVREWLAGEAVAEVSRWQAGEAPELAGRTLELSLPGFTRATTGWPADPDCRCRQPRHAELLGTLAG